MTGEKIIMPTVYLSGSSKDRRKQLRKLRRENNVVNVYGPTIIKTIGGKKVRVEDANTPQTIVVIA